MTDRLNVSVDMNMTDRQITDRQTDDEYNDDSNDEWGEFYYFIFSFCLLGILSYLKLEARSLNAWVIQFIFLCPGGRCDGGLAALAGCSPAASPVLHTH